MNMLVGKKSKYYHHSFIYFKVTQLKPLDIVRTRFPHQESPTEPGLPHPTLILELLEVDGKPGILGVQGVSDLASHLDMSTHAVISPDVYNHLERDTIFKMETAKPLPLSILENVPRTSSPKHGSIDVKNPIHMTKLGDALKAAGLLTERGLKMASTRPGPKYKRDEHSS